MNTDPDYVWAPEDVPTLVERVEQWLKAAPEIKELVQAYKDALDDIEELEEKLRARA